MELQEKLYTSTEVAQILGVSLRSVYRYMEEGKLDAEVKTATGRHRFTKKNILDFLYPSENSQSSNMATQHQEVHDTKVSTKNDTTFVIPQETPVVHKKEEKVEPKIETKLPEEPVAPVEVEEAPVDWLAKFREAANKFKAAEEAATQSQQPQQAVPETQPVIKEDISDLTQKQETPAAPVYEDDSTKFYYFRSMIGGLKDIAQSIDKNAKRATVEYAFTLNAGLSLHKPIKPFSVLHIYANQSDLEFFERSLNLVAADFRDAQLCIMVSPDKSVLKNRKEMHGLYVVSDIQLRRDLIEAGEHSLVSELESIIRF